MIRFEIFPGIWIIHVQPGLLLGKIVIPYQHTRFSLCLRIKPFSAIFFGSLSWILLFIQDAWNRVSIWPLTTNLNSGLLAALLSVWVSILPYPMKKPLFWFINNWIENFLYTWKVKKISSPFAITSVCNIFCINLCRLALQAASRYSDFRLAENRYSAQTFIYLR